MPGVRGPRKHSRTIGSRHHRVVGDPRRFNSLIDDRNRRVGTDTEQAPRRSARRTGGQRHPRRTLRNRPVSRVQPPHPPTTNTATNRPQSSRPHRNAPLSCKAEGIADTRTELIGHLDGRSPNTLKHNMVTAHFVMDNDDYPRYPAEIMVMGEWLNTLAHTIIQCQRHSHYASL